MAGFCKLVEWMVYMAKLALHKFGSQANLDDLTAMPEDVLEGNIFLGKGSEEKQTGTLPDKKSPTIILPANGEIKLEPGYYSGGKITQNIETFNAQTIGPGAKQITVKTAGKYGNGDITINPVKNLTPSVIKKGEYVAGVGPGLWEGYVNEDPYTPYLFGTFYGSQGITYFRYTTYRQGTGTVKLSKDHIEASAGSGETVAFVFDLPINLTNVKSVTVQMSGTGKVCKVMVCRNRVENYIEEAYQSGSSVQYRYNPNLGDILLDGSIGRSSSSGAEWEQEKTFTLSGITGNAYLYIGAFGAAFDYNLYLARFNL